MPMLGWTEDMVCMPWSLKSTRCPLEMAQWLVGEIEAAMLMLGCGMKFESYRLVMETVGA